MRLSVGLTALAVCMILPVAGLAEVSPPPAAGSRPAATTGTAVSLSDPIPMPLFDLLSFAPVSPAVRTQFFVKHQADLMDLDGMLWGLSGDGVIHTFALGGSYAFLKRFEVGGQMPLLVITEVDESGFHDEDATLGNLEIHGKTTRALRLKGLDGALISGALRVTLPTSTRREFRDSVYGFSYELEIPNDRYLSFEPHLAFGLIKGGFSAVFDVALSFIAIFPDDDDDDDEFRAMFAAHCVASYQFRLLEGQHVISPQLALAQYYQLNKRGKDPVGIFSADEGLDFVFLNVGLKYLHRSGGFGEFGLRIPLSDDASDTWEVTLLLRGGYRF